MKLNEYQKEAQRFVNKDLKHSEMLRHALFGMCSEVGELHGLYQKAYQGHPLNEEHMKKELGDVLWMMAEYCSAMGWNLGDIAQMNIDKLSARYPNGFEAEKSLHRKQGDI